MNESPYQHFDVRKPEEAAKLMETGQFWNIGPATDDMGLGFIIDGRVELTLGILQNIPAEYLSYINRQLAERGSPPIGGARE